MHIWIKPHQCENFQTAAIDGFLVFCFFKAVSLLALENHGWHWGGRERHKPFKRRPFMGLCKANLKQ